jgi:beta-glucosidase
MDASLPEARGAPGSFPADFLWGAATSAYQIEGSPLADGAGPSIWHRFAHTPGWVEAGDTGDVACDHYRRYAQDVDLMARLGLRAYRFSLSWSRILPAGRGRVNEPGLDFYRRLVDRLLERGIAPMATLYHWDLPAALDDRGGWLNPESPAWFAEYARVAFRALGDRVPLWATVNEPWVVVDAGYLFGAHAPGHRNLFEAPLAAHHLLCAHAGAVRVFRSESRQKIGLVVNLEPKEPASDAPEDVAAAARSHAYMNRAYLEPALFGRYPEEMPAIFGEAWPSFPEEAVRGIAVPLDFLGINYYSSSRVRHEDGAPPVRAAKVPRPEAALTDLGWEVQPADLTRTLCWVKERFGDIPLYVTENGAAFLEPPRLEGDVLEDPLRVDYLRRHLLAARDAIARGVNLKGYFVWSLLDNFEWAHGRAKRFGIVHVDYFTQRRTPKRSALYYRDVIRSGGGSLEIAPAEAP